MILTYFTSVYFVDEVSFQNYIIFYEIITQRHFLNNCQDPMNLFKLLKIAIKELYLIILIKHELSLFWIFLSYTNL